MGKKQVRELEGTLIGIQGGITMHRKLGFKFFVPQVFITAREQLEAARRDLEAMGLYEDCRDVLVRSEELVKLGPEYDLEAEMLILDLNSRLMDASGTFAAWSKKLRENPNATVDDFKPDPDGWAMEDEEDAKRRL